MYSVFNQRTNIDTLQIFIYLFRKNIYMKKEGHIDIKVKKTSLHANLFFRHRNATFQYEKQLHYMYHDSYFPTFPQGA